MKYIEAYLLALVRGYKSPSVLRLGLIFAQAGLKFDRTEAEKVIKECQGKTAQDLIKQGVQIVELEEKQSKVSNDDDDDDDDNWRGSAGSRCLMFFPTSGRMGFNQIVECKQNPSIEKVHEMIEYESQLRLSEPIQELIEIFHEDERSLT